jgi:hypothetical protein
MMNAGGSQCQTCLNLLRCRDWGRPSAGRSRGTSPQSFTRAKPMIWIRLSRPVGVSSLSERFLDVTSKRRIESEMIVAGFCGRERMVRLGG